MGGRIRQVPLVTIQCWQEGRALPVPSFVPHPHHGAEHGGDIELQGMPGQCHFQGPCGHGDRLDPCPVRDRVIPPVLAIVTKPHMSPRGAQSLPKPTLTDDGEKRSNSNTKPGFFFL